MKGSLRATGRLLVVDLGEVRRLVTESGPRLARTSSERTTAT